MHRIIGNLISNAIRYTNTGGVLIACRRREGKTWLEVWDTGVGIANDHTETIFEEFKQLGDTARNRGSGLGLSIVSKMAVLLGIQIRVRSRLGRGSVFALELPLSIENLPQSVHNHSDAATARNVGMLEHAPKANITRIAIIDDNPQVLNALAFSLENNGYQVVAANTGAQLIDSLGDIAPDLIISDYRLTNGQYGYGVIDAIKEKFGATLPSIIMTGDTDPVLMRSMAARGIPILYKPLQFDTLQAAMIKAISQGST
jgi:CheY-like chemotaxis protein